MGRYLLLWLLGIPIPILLLIWLSADYIRPSASRTGDNANVDFGAPVTPSMVRLILGVTRRRGEATRFSNGRGVAGDLNYRLPSMASQKRS
jgi:hypothetical protein